MKIEADLRLLLDSVERRCSRRVVIRGEQRADGYYATITVPDSSFTFEVNDSAGSYYFVNLLHLNISAELAAESEVLEGFMLRLGRVSLYAHISRLIGVSIGSWLEFDDGFFLAWSERRSLLDKAVTRVPGYAESRMLLVPSTPH